MNDSPDAIRDDLLGSAVTRRRLQEAAAEHERFERFCDRLRVPVCADAVTLYLAWLSETGDTSGRALRRALSALDAAARHRGAPPWGGTLEVRLFLRGLHQERSIGSTDARADPLYVELVHVLVEAVMSPTREQIRDRAVILLAHATRLSASAICRTRWDSTRLKRTQAVLDLPPPPKRPKQGVRTVTVESIGGPLCPVGALKRHREASGHRNGFIFATAGGLPDLPQVTTGIRRLSDANGDPAIAVVEASISPQQVRDRALLLMGYGAALRTLETIRLRQGDVQVTPHGLILRVRGRQQETGVPAHPGEATDPVNAWHAWLHVLDQQGRRHPDAPAFPQISGHNIWDKPVGESGLNYAIHQAVERAELIGTYAYTSLRSGLIRTALRADEQTHDIAAHTDLRSLGSVERHERRENLLRRSVAGQLGL